MPISKELIAVSKLPWFPNTMKELGYEPVRHGRWLKNGDRYCECSVCHHEGNTSGADNYCWFCGAKMDEVKDV